MKFLRYVIILVGLFGSTISLAANWSTGRVTIQSLTNWVGNESAPKEAVLIETKTQTSSTANPSNCPSMSYFYLPGASKISGSMLLTAFAAGTDVLLTISDGGCSSDGYPVIAAVTLAK